MQRELHDIYYTIQADIVVIDCPLFDTRNYKDNGRVRSPVADLALAILSHMAEEKLIEKKELQRQGIESARKRGKHLGRPKMDISEKTFRDVQKQVQGGLMSAVLGARKLGISKSTYYRLNAVYK